MAVMALVALVRGLPAGLMCLHGPASALCTGHCVCVSWQGTVVVEHAVVKEVKTPEELMGLVDAGTERRVVASTAMNQESSRSHMIVSIGIESVDKDKNLITGKVGFPPPPHPSLAALAADM